MKSPMKSSGIGSLAGAGLMLGALIVAPPGAADPAPACDYPYCTPGIVPHVVLGAPCESTTYYVYGVTDWGRLVFCGSPRRYDPRWFRSPQMEGVKEENSPCSGYDGHVAQAPDGLFLSCDPRDGAALWRRGDT